MSEGSRLNVRLVRVFEELEPYVWVIPQGVSFFQLRKNQNLFLQPDYQSVQATPDSRGCYSKDYERYIKEEKKKKEEGTRTINTSV